MLKKKKLEGSRKELYDYNFLHSKIPGTPNNLMGNPDQLKPKQQMTKHNRGKSWNEEHTVRTKQRPKKLLAPETK